MLPFLLKPYLKKVIWGGSLLSDFKELGTRLDHIGESWEVSAMPGCESIVASGEFEGMTLLEVCQKHGKELLGTEIYERYGGEMPLLVKFIDANDDLSIQVHPDDRIARSRHGCSGKCEMWYILDAKPGTKIVPGLNREISEDEFRGRVADGSFIEVLASYESIPGDIYYLPAGRVHAIGKGNLLLEVQQASDITYRIFDYNRRDANGNLRELHVDHAIDAIDYTAMDEYRLAADGETLARTPHFKVDKVELGASDRRSIKNDTFTIVSCVAGTAIVLAGGESMQISRGHTMIIPASVATSLEGAATLIIITP